MNTPHRPSLSRTRLERAFAGLVFSATVALVAGGAFVMALGAALVA